VFLKAYALTGTEPSLTRIKSYHFVIHTYDILRSTKLMTPCVYVYIYIYIYIYQLSYKSLPFMTGK
jgi:hypothetical protein